MAKFSIHVLRQDGLHDTIHYDNQTSELNWSDGRPVTSVNAGEFRDAVAVAVDHPGRKGTVRTLKISLGLSCNYACSYCSQRFVPHADSSNPTDIEPFLTQLSEALIEPPERIEFWGGEPFVYWKTLKPLAERLRAQYPRTTLSVITNGSLLDAEKNDWLDRLGFGVGLSHDGPGQRTRGIDPLDDPEKRAAIMDLYARLHPQGRISINVMLHRENQSRACVQTWLQERFGDDVRIGEGAFIDPYDQGGMASTLRTDGEHFAFRSRAFHELRLGKVANFDIAQKKIIAFVDSIRSARPASAVGQKCGMDKPGNLAVDLHGNVLTCQNVSASATAPNGRPHLIGNLSNLQAVKMRSASHWSQRKDCANCPVLQICQGSCMFLDGSLWEAGCDASYTDNVPFLAAAIEYLTGCIPYYIDGDFREERKDIFGFSEQARVPRDSLSKPFPIPVVVA
jgi:uncharacterized protein